MKLMLLKGVEALGKAGDVVEVSDGYARNFLLPRKLAAKPTPEALRLVEAGKRRVVRDEAKKQTEATAAAKTLENCSINIPARAGEGGHLFGSVSAADIAAALRADGKAVNDDQVRLERPIKELGIFDVPVVLHGEVMATVKVWVVEAKAPL